MTETRWQAYVDAARLAPSKHNAQPWWFEEAGGGAYLDVHADGARALPASDPQGRELVLGCGAALFNLCLAMRADGREPLVVTFPEGTSFSVVARVADAGAHRPAADELALCAAIPLRHSNRNPLDGSRLGGDVPFLLQRAAFGEGADLHLAVRPGARQAVADVVARADRIAARDPAVEAELRAWTRPPGSAAEDGVPATAAGPGAAAAYRARFPQRDFDVHGAVPSGRRDGGDVDEPLVGVVWTSGDRPDDWLRAGAAVEAVLLTATVHGAAASVLSTPIEVPSLRAAVRSELRLPGFPQAILRLGVGAPAVPTPRRPLEDVLLRMS